MLAIPSALQAQFEEYWLKRVRNSHTSKRLESSFLCDLCVLCGKLVK